MNYLRSQIVIGGDLSIGLIRLDKHSSIQPDQCAIIHG